MIDGLCVFKVVVVGMGITVDAAVDALLGTSTGAGVLGADSGCDELPDMIRALRC